MCIRESEGKNRFAFLIGKCIFSTHHPIRTGWNLKWCCGTEYKKHWKGQKLAPNKQANCRRQNCLKLTAVISFQLTEKVPRYPHQMFGNDYADCNANLAQRPYFQRPLLNLKSHVVKKLVMEPIIRLIEFQFWEVKFHWVMGWTKFLPFPPNFWWFFKIECDESATTWRDHQKNGQK